MSAAPRLLLLALVACGPSPTPEEPGDAPTSTPSTSSTVTGVAFAACGDPVPRWSTDVLAATAHPEHRFAGGGVAIEDMDGDGILDLLLADAAGPRVLLGPDFDAALPTPVPQGPLDAFTGIAVADVEGDGDVDVWWVRYGAPDVFWRNGPDGLAEEVTGLEGGGHHGQSAAWADLDGDDWLDLVIAGHGDPGVEGDQVHLDGPGDPTRLLRGGPDGLSSWPGGNPTGPFGEAYSFLVSPVDLDGDGRLDLFAANDYPVWLPQQTLWNEPAGFSLDDGATGLQPVAAGMGLGLGDADLDGAADLLLPVWDRVLLLESVGDGWVESASARGLRLPPRSARGGAWVGWGAELVDLDVDGHLDAIVAFGHLDTLAPRTVGGADASNTTRQGIKTWRGHPPHNGAIDGFVYEELGLQTGFGTDGPDGVHRGLALADLDDDGVLDLVAPDLSGNVFVSRSTCSSRPSLVVELVQPGPNRDAVGARVDAFVDDTLVASGVVRRGGTGLMSSGPATVHLGLPADTVRLQVTWPDGAVDALGQVQARQRLLVER